MFQKIRIFGFLCIVLLLMLVKIDVDAKENTAVTLETYDVVEGIVAPGETIKLSLTFANRNDKGVDEDVLVKAYSSNAEAYPIFGKSNQFYIGDLKAGKTFTQEIELIVAENMIDKEVLQLNFSIGYHNKISGNASNEVYIAIPISKKYEMSINDVTLPSDLAALKAETIGITYENIGQLEINNLKIVCTGNIHGEVMEYKADSLGVGIVNKIDSYIEFLEPGVQKLTISAICLDDEGKEQLLDMKIIDITINKNEDESNSEKDLLSDRSSQNTQLINQIALILCSLLVIIFIIIWKNKKKKISK